jgi:hypothetical protein
MAQKNLFRDILRLITPEEVAILTDSVLGRQKIMLKLIVQEDLGLIPPLEHINSDEISIALSENVTEPAEGLAKILPFDKNEEDLQEQVGEKKINIEPTLDTTADVSTLMQNEGAIEKIENHVEINEDGSVKFKEDELVIEEKVDLTEFFLSQQEKCKESSHGMKKKEIMELYNKNATVDLSRERAQRSNPSRKHNDGILINRKQS